MDSIKAIEVIKTWQGEIFSGQRVLLIRFSDCNRNCSYCDTRVKIQNFVEGEYLIQDIQSIVTQNDLDLLITGGEPTIQKNIGYTKQLLENIVCRNKYVETNGCNLLDVANCNFKGNVKYIYSPKDYDNKGLNECLKFLQNIPEEKLIIKIVHGDNNISEYFLSEILRQYNIFKNVYNKEISKPIIYIMPEGKTKDEIMRSAKDAFKIANKYGVNITTRLHLIHDFY